MSRIVESHRFSTFACYACGGFHFEPWIPPTPLPETISAPGSGVTHRRRRRYWLVDLENLTLGEAPDVTRIARLWRVLLSEAPGVSAQDHVVVSAGRWWVRQWRPGIVGHNVRWVLGANAPDGADRALLAAVDLRAVARKYDELVIASGDHAFADLARRAKKLGITVHVITTESNQSRPTLSGVLRDVADLHTLVRRTPRSKQPAPDAKQQHSLLAS